MISALLSFLGGSAFRLIWGEISSYLTARQDHRYELERLRLQGEMDAAQHARNLEAIRLQADLQVKIIEVQAQTAIDQAEVTAWSQAVADVGKQTGIRWIDTWNGSIRPMLATLAIAVVVAEITRNGFVLSDWDRELMGAILGIYVADRTLSKRGK